jgi:metal-responsive CopG/Arc/MetJ family transcriptional regulator
MSMVRLNITLPEELVLQIDRLAGPRKKSRFIAESLRLGIKRIQDKELQKTLEEGYRAGKQESQSVAKEFEHIDIEGWDEY